MAIEDLQSFKVDDEGDFVVDEDQYGNKSFRVITGIDVVRQNIQMRILTVLGERVLHPDYGMDFPSLEVPYDENLVRGEIVRTILEDPDVQEIEDIEVSFDGRTRHASFSGSILLKDGTEIGVQGTT